jgi:hypothetical protein
MEAEIGGNQIFNSEVLTTECPVQCRSGVKIAENHGESAADGTPRPRPPPAA